MTDEFGIFKYDDDGKKVYIAPESSSFKLEGKEAYSFNKGTLKISMSEKDLKNYTTFLYNGNKFEKPRTVYLSVPFLGNRPIPGVTNIEALNPELTNPFYSFNLKKKIVSIDINNPQEIRKESKLTKIINSILNK